MPTRPQSLPRSFNTFPGGSGVAVSTARILLIGFGVNRFQDLGQKAVCVLKQSLTSIIAAAGWEIAPGPLDALDKKTKIGTHFRWTGNKALGPHQFWNMPLLEISTNFITFPVVGAEIRVFADRSESTEFRIGLVFQ